MCLGSGEEYDWNDNDNVPNNKNRNNKNKNKNKNKNQNEPDSPAFNDNNNIYFKNDDIVFNEETTAGTTSVSYTHLTLPTIYSV